MATSIQTLWLAFISAEYQRRYLFTLPSVLRLSGCESIFCAPPCAHIHFASRSKLTKEKLPMSDIIHATCSSFLQSTLNLPYRWPSLRAGYDPIGVFGGIVQTCREWQIHVQLEHPLWPSSVLFNLLQKNLISRRQISSSKLLISVAKQGGKPSESPDSVEPQHFVWFVLWQETPKIS